VPGAAIKNTCLTVHIVLLGFSYRIFESVCVEAPTLPRVRLGLRLSGALLQLVQLYQHDKVAYPCTLPA